MMTAAARIACHRYICQPLVGLYEWTMHCYLLQSILSHQSDRRVENAPFVQGLGPDAKNMLTVRCWLDPGFEDIVTCMGTARLVYEMKSPHVHDMLVLSICRLPIWGMSPPALEANSVRITKSAHVYDMLELTTCC